VPGTGVETFSLTLVSALSFNPGADANHPPYDYKFVFGTSSVPGRKVKVESIRPVSESIVELTAVDETPEYYAAKDLPFTYVGPRLGGAPVITDLQITEDGVRVAGGYMVKGTVTFNITGDYESCDIRISINGSQWTSLANNSRVSSAEFIAPDFSDVVVEVTAHGRPGARTAEGKATLTKTLDFAGESPPANVTQFTIDGRTFRWQPVEDVDVKGYVIRFQYGQNLSFPDATRLHEGVLPYSPKTFDTLPTGFCTFFITAIDAADLESVTPAIVVTDLGDPETENVVVRTDLRTLSWPGSVTGGSNVAGELRRYRHHGVLWRRCCPVLRRRRRGLLRDRGVHADGVHQQSAVLPARLDQLSAARGFLDRRPGHRDRVPHFEREPHRQPRRGNRHDRVVDGRRRHGLGHRVDVR
jgi:hypothetical protein